ncbi:MAG: NDP-sugar synthase [Actinobacteria bacterium]|nr:NDP-sugar synthase [Actinomycetota bacterium]
MSTVRDAMIVAGGRGTRLQPLTHATPKPLLPFCGEPFLAGVIARLAGAGVERVFLVVGSDTAPFEGLRPHAAAVGVEIVLVPEPEPLDTAGGVRAAVDQVSGTFLVLNGDILTDVDYPAVVAAHEAAGAAGTIVLTTVEDTSSFGVCVRDGTRITAFVEKPAPGSLPGQDTINAGTYVLEPALFEGLPEGRLSFERQVFPAALERGRHLEGVVHDGVWADLGTPERYREGHRLALSGAMSWPGVDAVPDRGGGVRVHADATVAADADLVGPLLVLEGARIDGGATVGPDVVVGSGSSVGTGATLSDSVLFDRVTVGADVAVTGLLAGADVTIEGGARLGRGIVIGDAEHIPAGTVLDDDARVPTPRG